MIQKAAVVYRLKHTRGAVYARFGAEPTARVREDLATLRTAPVLVVLHLYYPEMWPVFERALRRMAPLQHNIAITVPHSKMPAARKIVPPSANTVIIGFHNHGRDVWPFLQVAKVADELGYSKILKLHSKKSTHRTDGADWSNRMVSSLIPGKSAVEKAVKILDSPQAGLIGPYGEYMSLSVNFSANGMHMSYILRRLYSKELSYRILQRERDLHGFFAGSMFWVSAEALRPLLRRRLIDAAYFEKEAGQIDGTYAHAVERVISLIMQVEHKKLYSMTTKGPREIAYDSGVIPDWSDVYIGPTKP